MSSIANRNTAVSTKAAAHNLFPDATQLLNDIQSHLASQTWAAYSCATQCRQKLCLCVLIRSRLRKRTCKGTGCLIGDTPSVEVTTNWPQDGVAIFHPYLLMQVIIICTGADPSQLILLNLVKEESRLAHEGNRETQ